MVHNLYHRGVSSSELLPDGSPPSAKTDRFRTIRYERSGFIGRLTLARPEKRNAQNPTMWREIRDLGVDLVDDPDLRCLVIAGAGPCFSAGIDLVEGLAGTVARWAADPSDPAAASEGVAAAGTFRWIGQLACPSVAVVHGHAYGAGLQLALACDLRIFARTTQVGLVETRFGIMPDMGATVRLPRIVGDGRARELILLGRTIDAAEAHRIGLANWIVADAELDQAARALAAELAGQPPVALRSARRALQQAWNPDEDAAFEAAISAQADCLSSQDFAEGLSAFAEQRPPVWNGR
jgi:enoyl-CoA hydratase/carnithine racemase